MAQSVPTRHPRKVFAPSVPVRTADERRESSSARGYGTAWTKYSLELRRERVLCELCLAACGVETGIAGQTTTASGRKRSQGVVDHIVPIDGPDDPLFWEPLAVWCLCNSCNDFKSRLFDGTFGARKQHAEDRTLAGVSRRRAEIVLQMRVSRGIR